MNDKLKRLLFEVYSSVSRTAVSLRKRVSLGKPVCSSQSFAPAFIIGSGRSGNTLLRRILSANPDVFIPPETYVLGKSINQWTFSAHLSLSALQHRFYQNLVSHSEFHTFGIKDTLALKDALVSADNTSLADTLNAFYAFYRQAHGEHAHRWIDKTPLNTLYVEQIYSVFPDAKFIVMSRDPCDVVSSYMKSGIFPDFEVAAHRWYDSMKSAKRMERKHPDAVMVVKYESLVSAPEETTRNICRFLDLEYTADMIESHQPDTAFGDVEKHAHHANVHNPIQTTSIGKGKAALNKTQQQFIDQLQAKLDRG